MIHALESADASIRSELRRLMSHNDADKVEKVLAIFRETGVDAWALELKHRYVEEAARHLEDIAVTNTRKSTLLELMRYLIQRDR